MAQVSDSSSAEVGGELPRPSNAGENTDDGKGSLLSKVTHRAMETFSHLRRKSKKDGEGEEYHDVEESSSEAQKEPKADTATDEHLGPRVSFEGESKEDLLSPFARSGQSDNSPVIAVPTTYGEANYDIDAGVDAVMPPPVIEPTSVSELGEESSQSLGYIPEAKDEEKAAAREVQEGGPDSDMNEGFFKDTFQQKDLQAIDGLPKPRGFDVGDESSVRSNDFTKILNSPETGGSAAETDQSRGIEEDNKVPHAPGSTAEFDDSMSSSTAAQDLDPNEPPAQEAKRAGDIGVFSKDDSEASKPSGSDRDFSKDEAAQVEDDNKVSHAPGTEAEFDDSMFSSNAAQDLEPNVPPAQEAKRAGEIGVFSKDDAESNKPSGSDRDFSKHEASQMEEDSKVPHAPGTEAEFNDSMFSSKAAQDLEPNKPPAQEAKRAGEIGVFSKDDSEANKPSGSDKDFSKDEASQMEEDNKVPHAPGTEAEFDDSMFSSNAAQDLEPNEPPAQEAKHGGEIGVFSRDSAGDQNTDGEFQDAPSDFPPPSISEDQGGESENFEDAPKDLPPPSLAGDPVEDQQQTESTSAGIDKKSDHQNKKFMTPEEEAENYFDLLLDADLVSQISLDSDIGTDFNPEAAPEFEEQREALAESADSRITAAKNEETASDNNILAGISTLTSTLKSVVDNVSSKAVLIRSSSLSRSQRDTSQRIDQSFYRTSTVDKVACWVSAALDVILPEDDDDEDDETKKTGQA